VSGFFGTQIGLISINASALRKQTMHFDVNHFWEVTRNMADMKYVWKIMVRTALDEADRRQGYVLAGSMGEALELAGHPDAVAIPQVDKLWPGSEGENVCWN
jgi:hypothetical protein